MDQTHDPALRSFIPVAPDSDFPIQNLPFGIFRPRSGGEARVGTIVGHTVVDLAALERRGLFAGPELRGKQVFARPSLNRFMELGRPAWREARLRLVELLREEASSLRDDAGLRAEVLVPEDATQMCLPCEIGDYTDFYSSREHATNVGMMFRGAESALMPNWLHLPVAYHGRAGTVVVSGTDFHRPMGQSKADDAANPGFGPSRALDFELEVGFFVGPGSAMGEAVPVERAFDHIFGFVLVNDWSARDIQKWEYQPLGPFLGKNFCTSISPWVVTLEALEPFRCAGPVQDPAPLSYLRNAGERTFDIELEVRLRTPSMGAGDRISGSNFRSLYWDPSQQLAHHSVNGCRLRAGDLLASGTISGAAKDSRGSLLELCWKGTEPLRLSSGETRTYLQDGDELTLSGHAVRGPLRVGFGEVRGRVLPARG
ncbi:MAG: fumarylacetoacetase [Candidatus Eisenbacteria bacterium]|nr:fumarylacetoacetase [Candidatus Eisenbacteria bacterium]